MSYIKDILLHSGTKTEPAISAREADSVYSFYFAPESEHWKAMHPARLIEIAKQIFPHVSVRRRERLEERVDFFRKCIAKKEWDFKINSPTSSSPSLIHEFN